MKLKKLGSTKLRVSPLGLGMAALGRPGYITLGHGEDLSHATDVKSMEDNAHRVLDLAWEKGIRYFDAARSYGKSEKFLSSWLKSREIPCRDIAVGSKWGYRYTADWHIEAEHHEIKEHSLAHLKSQWEESGGLLSGHLSLYQIHSATLESGVLDNARLLRHLHEIRLKEGVAMGLSLSGARQGETLEKARRISFDGIPLFDTVQVTYNILETSPEEALEEARAAGMGIIVKEALANGRLTPRNTDPAFHTKIRVLKEQSERLDCSMDALVLAGVLAKPWAHVVLSGAACGEHLASNLKAMDVPWDSQAADALAELKEPPEAYWAFRKTLAWN